MADKEITWESVGADKVARDARDIARAQGEAEDATKKSSKAASENAGTWADVAKAAIAAKLVYEGVNEVLAESVPLYANVNAEQGQILRDLRQMGVDGPKAAQAMRDINQRFRDNIQFGAKISEQTTAFRNLLDVTKDRAAAERDLALAIDIRADKGLDLAKTTEIVSKVEQGEVEVLKELGVLTKTQTEQLAGVTDEAQRSAIAMAILRDEFGGAAVENKGLADQLDANEAQYERLQLAIGKVASELGEEGAGLVGRILDTVSASERGTFTIDNFATAFENFADQIPTATENLGYFLDEINSDDFLEIWAEGGAFTEAGRARIRAVAGRGRRRAEAGGGGGGGDAGPGGAGGGGGSGSADEFVGPVLSPEDRIKRARDEQQAEIDAERARLEAIRERERAEAEAEKNRQERWERQMARLQQDREETAKAAEEAAELAEKQAEAEAKAIATRRAEAERWARDQEAFAQSQRDQEAMVAAKREEAALTAIDAASQVGSAALEGAGFFLQGENAKNIKAGLGETAKAAAAIAAGVTTGNPLQFVGAGLHTLAAGQFFSAAGRNTGVAPKGGSGGGGGGGSAPAPPSVPAATRRDADLIGERGPAPSQLPGITNVYQSYWPPTPQMVADANRRQDRDRRRRV